MHESSRNSLIPKHRFGYFPRWRANFSYSLPGTPNSGRLHPCGLLAVSRGLLTVSLRRNVVWRNPRWATVSPHCGLFFASLFLLVLTCIVEGIWLQKLKLVHFWDFPGSQIWQQIEIWAKYRNFPTRSGCVHTVQAASPEATYCRRILKEFGSKNQQKDVFKCLSLRRFPSRAMSRDAIFFKKNPFFGALIVLV